MGKLRQLFSTLLSATILTTCLFAQSNLTQIRDTIYNADGTPFNGTVVITWNGFSTPTTNTISPLSTSARIYNGTLSVLLVPSTTAASGSFYQAVYYSNSGTVSWTEAWSVPPSANSLSVSAVRTSTTAGSTGSGTGSSGTGTTPAQYATLPIAINQITGLSSDLNAVNSSIASLTTTVNALPSSASLTTLSSTVDGLSTTVGGLNTTVTNLSATTSNNATTLSGLTTNVGNLSSTVSANSNSLNSLTSSLSGLTSTVNSNSAQLATVNNTVNGLGTTAANLSTSVAALQSTVNNLASNPTAAFIYIDGETPAGAVNGTNRTFTLAYAPTPAMDLKLYKNGILQQQNGDYMLNGTTVTFVTGSTPQATDSISAYYRH